MPVIVTREVKDAATFHVERDIEVIRQLIEEMARIRSFIAAAPVIGAAHVGPRADPLIGPACPLPIRVQTDGNHRRLRGTRHGKQSQPADENAQPGYFPAPPSRNRTTEKHPIPNIQRPTSNEG